MAFNQLSSNLKTILFLGFASVSAMLLRLYHLETYTFWYDESVVALAECGITGALPLSKLLEPGNPLNNVFYLFSYNHCFIYYWREFFGQTEFVLRLSSAIFSLLSLYVLFFLAKDFFTKRIAYISALLLIFSPIHIYYAQELRPYSATAMLTLISAYAFFKAIKGGGKQYWCTFVLSQVVSIYFHYMGLLVTVSFGIFFLLWVRDYKERITQFVITYLIILLLIIPILLSIYPLVRFIATTSIHPEMSEYPVWAGGISIWNLASTFKNFSIGYNVPLTSIIGFVMVSTYFGFFILGAFKFHKNPEMKIVLLSVIIPILLLFLISQFITCYVDRYFFSIYPLFILCVAAGLSVLNKKVLIGALFFIAAINGYGLSQYYTNNYPMDDPVISSAGIGEKQDVRTVSHFLAAHYEAGDRVLHSSKSTVFPAKFYIRKMSENPALIEEVDKGAVVFNREENALYLINYNKSWPVFSSRPFSFSSDLAKIDRLWLIHTEIGPDTINELKKVGYATDRVAVFNGGTLYLCIKKKVKRNQKLSRF